MTRTMLAVVLAVALTGCTVAGAEEARTAGSPEPVETPRVPVVVPDIPRQSTDVEALAQARPVAPSQLNIDAVDISMDVVPVGVERTGEMEIPTSALDAGWYRHGAAPLDMQGNVVIAAHVDDAQVGLGPFASLRDIDKGDMVELTLADGTVVLYEVVRIEQTAKTEVDTDLLFAVSNEPHLVLVTCGGSYDRSARSYRDNVVVWAAPVQDPK